MCTPYYRQLQVDNQELLEKLDLLESTQVEDTSRMVPALQRELVRLREDKHELQVRVSQLEAENRGFATVVRRVGTELPPVMRPYESSYVVRSPQKPRTHSHRPGGRDEGRLSTGGRDDSRHSASGSKQEAIEALSQLLLNRAAYSRAQR